MVRVGETLTKQPQEYLCNGALHINRLMGRTYSKNWGPTWCAKWKLARAKYFNCPKDENDNYLMQDEPHLCQRTGKCTDKFGEEAAVCRALLVTRDEHYPLSS